MRPGEVGRLPGWGGRGPGQMGRGRGKGGCARQDARWADIPGDQTASVWSAVGEGGGAAVHTPSHREGGKEADGTPSGFCSPGKLQMSL